VPSLTKVCGKRSLKFTAEIFVGNQNEFKEESRKVCGVEAVGKVEERMRLELETCSVNLKWFCGETT
jgi:hypothetical protein